MICEVKHCSRDGILLYGGKEVCDKHWTEQCNNRLDLKDPSVWKGGRTVKPKIAKAKMKLKRKRKI